tara:strand:+ start:680 stop:1177 length:498 start_codon:yes stop_codon:yes gene_type:complete
MAWPSGSKAGTTNVDAGTDSVSNARADIKQNIDNVNTIIDFYDATGPYATKGEYSKQQYFDMTTLTATNDSSGGIAWDLSANQVAQLTLAANSTLANPTNIEAGATYVLIVKQDGTGSRTLAYDSKYKFPAGSAPTLSTGANEVDVLCFVSDGTNLYGNAMLDMS